MSRLDVLYLFFHIKYILMFSKFFSNIGANFVLKSFLNSVFKLLSSIFANFFAKLFQAKYFYAILIFLMSCVVFGVQFQNPAGLFWDENYHIVSAEKYRQQTFFLEPHPPLGKMIIAFFESTFGLNSQLNTQPFLTTDKIDTVPEGYSFFAVRLPSVLAAIGCVFVLYWIAFLILKNPFFSFISASFLLFDNAFILHSRGAMLESMQLFFILLSIFLVIFAIQKRYFNLSIYGLISLSFGLALSVKVNSLILILPLFAVSATETILNLKESSSKTLTKLFKKIALPFLKLICSILIIFCVFASTQGIHAFVAKNPYQGRFYNTSEEYRNLIQNSSWLDFPKVALETTKTWYEYQNNYQKGVPSFDPQKEDENGSLPWMWPFGARAIAYRWGTFLQNEKTNQTISLEELANQPESEKANFKTKTQYLYLISNLFIWFLSLFSIIFLSVVFLIKLLNHNSKNPLNLVKIKSPVWFQVTSIFVLSSFWGYLLAVSLIPRVMYLYHYFIPLTFGLIAWILVIFLLSQQKFAWLNTAITLTFLVSIMCFLWFSPFTYFIPLTFEQFQLRNWLPFWNMKWKG